MFDTGTTAFMMVCTMLVFLMTPGLAFFYGGLSRRKNVVNTMIMTFAALGIVGVAWVLAGWSFAYGGDGSVPFFGDSINLAACRRPKTCLPGRPWSRVGLFIRELSMFAFKWRSP